VKLTHSLAALWVGIAAFAAASQLRAVGADTPFTTLEAEAGSLTGGAKIHAFILGSPVPTSPIPELESSGGAFVKLARTGDAITWSNPVDGANALVVRSSLPDTPDGGGIAGTLNLYVDGGFRQAVTLSSKQSWVYRKPGTWFDDPHSGGVAFKFYNEDHTFITGAPIPKGSLITLRKDADSTAPEYNLDCIDLEAVAPPAAQPAGSLSVLDYGARPDTETDSQEAISNCIADAATKGMSVWLPPGRYLVGSVVSGGIAIKGVAVRGAGMWHTTLYRRPPVATANSPKLWRTYIQLGAHSTVSDLSIDCNSVRRAIGKPGGGDYSILASGEGWLVDRIWARHCDATWLSGSHGTIRNSRVSDSWGDGINLNNGNTPHPDRLGHYLTAENNFVRGTGDDGLATYSDRGKDGTNGQMIGATFLNNTAVAPYWANSLRVAGGRDVIVRGNLLTDPAANSGMNIGIFGDSGQPIESALIEHNVIRRGGGWNGTDRHGVVFASRPDQASVVTFRDNSIEDSRRSGLTIAGTLHKLIIENNRITRPAASGILVEKGVSGIAIVNGNQVTGLAPGEVLLKNNSPATFTASPLSKVSRSPRK